MTARASADLTHNEIRAVLSFLSDVHDLPLDQPYPPELIARLGDLIPGAHVVYRENDLRGRRTPRMTDEHATYVDDADELYWAVGPCSITDYRSRTGDLSALRLTDVVSWRRYRESAVYRDYFHPSAVDYMLDLGLQASDGWQRTMLFCRERGDRDFSERDRAALEILRPHLRAREAQADLRRRLMDDTSIPRPGRPGIEPDLTSREREILFLVAAGMTNARIAAELWVAPSTVKKHLENVYEKLGVSGRAAAVMNVRRIR